ncbi:MAG TPA: signal peptidase II [Bacteroidota bacterium]
MTDTEKQAVLPRNFVRALYISAAVVLVDQATKLLVKGFSLPFLNFNHVGLEPGTSIQILGDALRLTFIENPGMAFGIELGSGLYLALFSLIASAGIFYYLYRVRDQSFVVRASLALILGGAIGNLIDRVFYGVLFGNGTLFHGKVVDFVDVNVLHLSQFGIFNVADAAVTTGVVMLLLVHRHLDIEPEPAADSTRGFEGPASGHGNRSSETKAISEKSELEIL